MIGLAGLALVWQLVVWTGLVPEQFLPGVVPILHALWEQLGSAEFWHNEGLTFVRAAAGLVLAAVTGIGVAVLGARYPVITRALDPLVQVMLALPPAALVPLTIFALGLGWTLYAFIIWFAAFFGLYARAANALQSSEPVQWHASRTFGYNEWQILWRVRLPAAAPEIFTGVRVAAAISLMATVASEMLAGSTGLGKMMVETAFSMRIPTMFALLAVAALNGALLNALVMRVRKTLVGWQDQLTAQAGG